MGYRWSGIDDCENFYYCLISCRELSCSAVEISRNEWEWRGKIPENIHIRGQEFEIIDTNWPVSWMRNAHCSASRARFTNYLTRAFFLASFTRSCFTHLHSYSPFIFEPEHPSEPENPSDLTAYMNACLYICHNVLLRWSLL